MDILHQFPRILHKASCILGCIVCNLFKEFSYLGRVLLKVVSPHVDVNVDVDVTYDFFAFY